MEGVDSREEGYGAAAAQSVVFADVGVVGVGVRGGAFAVGWFCA